MIGDVQRLRLAGGEDQYEGAGRALKLYHPASQPPAHMNRGSSICWEEYVPFDGQVV